MPKFSKVVVGYIPNEPPRWPSLTKTVKHIVEVYAANANKYERLGDWAERIGWESFFKLTGLQFTHHPDRRLPRSGLLHLASRAPSSSSKPSLKIPRRRFCGAAGFRRKTMADEKDVVVDFLKSKSASKSKFYFKDFTELFPDKGPP